MRFSFLLFILCACTHLPEPQLGHTLFPENTYKHNVTIEVKNRGSFPAHGVLHISQKELKLFLLGPGDLTVATIHETFAPAHITVRILMPEYKIHEDSLRRFYPLLRNFILYPRHTKQWGGWRVSTSTMSGMPHAFSGPQAMEIKIIDFKNNHPTHFKIVHAQFSVTVEEFL